MKDYIFLSKVPAMIMITMAPLMLNAKTPVQYVPTDEGDMIEMFEQAFVEANDRTYVAKPQEFQQSYPLGVAYLTNRKIRQIVPAIGNGVKANLVLATRYYDNTPNNVEYVYYIKNSYNNNRDSETPPIVKELVYHNLGADKEFLGITIRETFYKDGVYNSAMVREVKLDDKSAQFLLDLQADKTKWTNKTGITFRETTNPNVAPAKKY